MLFGFEQARQRAGGDERRSLVVGRDEYMRGAERTEPRSARMYSFMGRVLLCCDAQSWVPVCRRSLRGVGSETERITVESASCARALASQKHAGTHRLHRGSFAASGPRTYMPAKGPWPPPTTGVRWHPPAVATGKGNFPPACSGCSAESNGIHRTSTLVNGLRVVYTRIAAVFTGIPRPT